MSRTIKRQSSPPSPSSGQMPHDDARHFVRPDYDIPEVPLDLTSMDDDRLMTLFAQAVAWQNFAATIATEAEVREADAERAVAQAEAEVMIRSWTGAKEDRVTIAKAQRDTDRAVVEATTVWDRAKASRKRAQTVRDNAERIANLVSRELTRRVGRDPVERRNMRWNP